MAHKLRIRLKDKPEEIVYELRALADMKLLPMALSVDIDGNDHFFPYGNIAEAHFETEKETEGLIIRPGE